MDANTTNRMSAADALMRDLLRNATRDDVLINDEILAVAYVEEISVGGIQDTGQVRVQARAGGGGFPLLGTAVLSAFAGMLALLGLFVAARKKKRGVDDEVEDEDEDEQFSFNASVGSGARDDVSDLVGTTVSLGTPSSPKPRLALIPEEKSYTAEGDSMSSVETLQFESQMMIGVPPKEGVADASLHSAGYDMRDLRTAGVDMHPPGYSTTSDTHSSDQSSVEPPGHHLLQMPGVGRSTVPNPMVPSGTVAQPELEALSASGSYNSDTESEDSSAIKDELDQARVGGWQARLPSPGHHSPAFTSSPDLSSGAAEGNVAGPLTAAAVSATATSLFPSDSDSDGGGLMSDTDMDEKDLSTHNAWGTAGVIPLGLIRGREEEEDEEKMETELQLDSMDSSEIVADWEVRASFDVLIDSSTSSGRLV